jgi:hypothetical protein
MNQQQTNDLTHYRVTVGFSQVKVQGRDREEALSAARRMLSQDAPRLWDVIAKMESHRFQVDPLA